MSEYNKHLELAKEKLKILAIAYNDKKSSVVGDMGTKVVEQLVEADLARRNIHYTKHYDRHQYINNTYPPEIQNATKKIWYAYSDLGYDGQNGKQAEKVIHNLKKVLIYFEGLLNEKLTSEKCFT